MILISRVSFREQFSFYPVTHCISFDRSKYFTKLIGSKYTAIRLLEQTTYEQLVPLAISPPPDVITRVVILLRSLTEDEAATWTEARQRKELGSGYWRDIIGFDERALDGSLYRALEWRVVEIPEVNAVA